MENIDEIKDLMMYLNKVESFTREDLNEKLRIVKEKDEEFQT